MQQHNQENGAIGRMKSNSRTVAKFNAKMMERLQKALEQDASVDLSTILPKNYQSRRHIIQQEEEEYQKTLITDTAEKESCFSKLENAHIKNPIRAMDLPQNSANIVFTLSVTAMVTLQLSEEQSKDGEYLATRLKSVLLENELLHSLESHTYLVRCSNDLVIKCYEPDLTTNGMDFTEFTSLQYLEQHISNIPAPKPHGLIVSGSMAYLLMSYVPGQTLESAWPLLTERQKLSLQNELQDIFVKLRNHPKPSDMDLGGVYGEGCKDMRRGLKISSKPLKSPTDFWNFVYGSAMWATPMYTQTLRSWFDTTSTEKCVFTHGDLRPANIHVQKDGDQYYIAGILDWETSGFYPASWESCKITNCFSPVDKWDWYLYVPPCISPPMYSYRWLLDRFWNICIVSESGIKQVG